MIDSKTSWPGGRWTPGVERYGVVQVDHVPVVMPDGIKLDATIAYPADPNTSQRTAGRFPVIVSHTPYNDQPNTFFTRHGYIVANVRVRGTGRSEGVIDFMGPKERADGPPVIDWAAKLDGSDGRVGMYGCSYEGGQQWGAASMVSPNSPLKAIIPACIGLDRFLRDSFLSNGVPQPVIPGMLQIALMTGNQPGTVEHFKFMQQSILNGGDLAYLRDFWNDRLPISAAQKIVNNGIAVLMWISSTEDAETFRSYSALQNAALDRPLLAPMYEGQPASGRYQIIAGNWTHGGGLDPLLMLAWYDTFVKGEETGINKIMRPMHLQEAGSGRWFNTAVYPLVSTYQSFFIGANGALHKRPPQTATQMLSLTEPDQPKGSLAYISAPFGDGATLAGPISATIHASSNNTNLLLILRLYDVAPDGTETEITNGVTLGSQREIDPVNSWRDKTGVITRPYFMLTHDNLLTPHQPYELNVDLHTRISSIAPGHRLKLTLTTKATEADKKVSLGRLPSVYTEPQQQTLPGGEYTILTGVNTPSAVHLPLLPYGSFPTAASGRTPYAINPRAGTTTTSDGPVLPFDWGEHDR